MPSETKSNRDLWLSLIPLIVEFGLEAAEFIALRIQANAEPTAADWAELKALARKTSADYLREAQEATGS